MHWFATHWVEVGRLTLEHALLCLVAAVAAVVIALPVGVFVHGNRRRETVVMGATGLLYTVPSLALFAVLVPLVGLGRVPAMIGLVLYSQLILVRGVVTALDSVASDTRDAALGMGLGGRSVLAGVDLPLAAPVFLASVRMAVVTLIGIATVAAVIDGGGLGELILQGLQQDFPAKVVTGAVAVTILAVAADFALQRLERSVSAWERPA